MMFLKIRRDFEVLVNKRDVTNVIMEATANKITNFKIGNCGWKKAPNCYFVVFHATQDQYIKTMENLNKKHVKILPESTGY